VPVRRTENGLAFAAPPLLRSGPVDDDVVEHIADLLGIARDDILDAQWADNGPAWVALLLASAEAVLALRPQPVDLDIGVVGPYASGAPRAFEMRAFFPPDTYSHLLEGVGRAAADAADAFVPTRRAAAQLRIDCPAPFRPHLGLKTTLTPRPCGRKAGSEGVHHKGAPRGT
jgi:hypothetical protein